MRVIMYMDPGNDVSTARSYSRKLLGLKNPLTSEAAPEHD